MAKAKTSKPTGRPSSYTDETADEICVRLAQGRSLRSICADADMPSQSAVFKWLRDNERFQQQYAHAREAQADALFDETLEIADGSAGDVQRDRLRVDTRKWMAGKLRPKVYGDRVELNHSGHIQTMTDDALESRIAQLLGASGTAGPAGGEGEEEGAA